jgi:coatomer protein complex subunit gamma
LSGIQLFAQHEEMVRKWTNEVSEKLNSKEQATKFHALILLYEIKKKDSNAVKKVLNALMKENLTELASVQLIRMIKNYIEDVDHSSEEAAVINKLFRTL